MILMMGIKWYILIGFIMVEKITSKNFIIKVIYKHKFKYLSNV